MDNQNNNLSDFSAEYINKVNQVINSAETNIVAVTGKEGSGKETFFNEVNNSINVNYNKESKNNKETKQAVILENINTDNIISKVIDNVFPDSSKSSINDNNSSNQQKNLFWKTTGLKSIKALIDVPNYNNNKQKKFRESIDTVTNKITTSDYNKLQRKYTIISLVASVLASLGSSIFILGCTNLRYLLPSNSEQTFMASDWAQTLGLIVPGIFFIFCAWFLFYLYYKNYKIEKNMPMNLEDQSNILLKLIQGMNQKQSYFKRLIYTFFKIFDLRSYLHFKSIFLSKSKDIIIVPTVFIIKNFSMLNVNEQLDLLKAMSILEKSKYLDFIVFLNDEDLARIGEEQIRLLNKYINTFIEIKYDQKTAYKLLSTWLSNNFKIDDENNNWFKFATLDAKQKIYSDIEEIFSNFVVETSSYTNIENFISDMNVYLQKVGNYVQYISPIEIILMYILKYTKSDIFNYILKNGSGSLNISFNLDKLNNPTSINELGNSIIEQDKFIYLLVTNNKFLREIKCFNYLFLNISFNDNPKVKVTSKFYQRFYSILHSFLVFDNQDKFIESISSFLDNINGTTAINNCDDLFTILFNFKNYSFINSSAIFDTILSKNISSDDLITFVNQKIMIFLNEKELENILKKPINNVFDWDHYLYTLAKMYVMAIIKNEEVLVNELDKFSVLLTYVSNLDSQADIMNVLPTLSNLITNNPSLFYSIYLMINVLNYDDNFFSYNFRFNIIKKSYIDIYNLISDRRIFNGILDHIKTYSINWSIENTWRKYGFIWLQYYLLFTNDAVNISNLISKENSLYDYYVITFILLNYKSYISLQKVIPFNNINFLLHNVQSIISLLNIDIKTIFVEYINKNILLFKVGNLYYQFDTLTNQIEHIYSLDIWESYGAFN